MPYKFIEPRRHKVPRQYRVTNWPDYDAALIQRDALTVWFTDEAIAEWRAPPARSPPREVSSISIRQPGVSAAAKVIGHNECPMMSAIHLSRNNLQ
jgi:hypothetical protein